MQRLPINSCYSAVTYRTPRGYMLVFHSSTDCRECHKCNGSTFAEFITSFVIQLMFSAKKFNVKNEITVHG